VSVSLDTRRVHFVGIGGAGMSGIAAILLARGARVSGTDAKDSATVQRLRAAGARIELGHTAAALGDAEVLVVSTAIRPDNPELVAARERGLPVLHRAEALAAVMADQVGLAVAGTHGKTTTSSLLTAALDAAGQDPSYAIGGDLAGPGSNARHGAGRFFVAEADESDGSFLRLAPTAAIVTNVEADHLDHWGDAAAVAAGFAAFAAALPAEGFLVACADDPGAAALAAGERAAATVTYGVADGADLQLAEPVLSPGGSAAAVRWRGLPLGELRLSVPGRHNALNAAGVLALGMSLALDPADLLAGLAAFRGVGRRFEDKGSAAGVRVVDDYGHHPTEITATLAAARTAAGDGRVVVAFQPHRYTRTRDVGASLGRSLGDADEVVVLDIYGAGEDPLPGVDSDRVAGDVPLPAGRVHRAAGVDEAAVLVAHLARPGDLVLSLGAGDVTRLGPALLAALTRSTAVSG
jgi:UDP-N-acetylmuramate--alanine ligase